MARFIADFTVARPDADRFIGFIVRDFFQKEGFKYMEFKGENVWKKGTGALAAPQFIKLRFKNGQVHLEAWLRAVWLPGVYGKEMDFSGAWGFAVKEMFHGTVNQLIGLLLQPQMIDGNANAQPQQPVYGQQQAYGQQPYGQPQQYQAGQPVPQQQAGAQAGQQQVPVIVHNTKGSAVLALVMGLVGVLGIWVPLVGVICGIVAILSGKKGRHSPAAGMATAGMVLGIVFLVIAVIGWVRNIILFAALLY